MIWSFPNHSRRNHKTLMCSFKKRYTNRPSKIFVRVQHKTHIVENSSTYTTQETCLSSQSETSHGETMFTIAACEALWNKLMMMTTPQRPNKRLWYEHMTPRHIHLPGYESTALLVTSASHISHRIIGSATECNSIFIFKIWKRIVFYSRRKQRSATSEEYNQRTTPTTNNYMKLLNDKQI